MTIDAKDLVKVIKACKASGVSALKLGDLELKFQTGDAEKTSVPATGDAVETPSAEKLKAIEERSALIENAEDADEELAHMQVENPAQFEELLVQRELISGGSDIIEDDNRRVEQALSGG